jgi:hypothetical protein
VKSSIKFNHQKKEKPRMEKFKKRQATIPSKGGEKNQAPLFKTESPELIFPQVEQRNFPMSSRIFLSLASPFSGKCKFYTSFKKWRLIDKPQAPLFETGTFT